MTPWTDVRPIVQLPVPVQAPPQPLNTAPKAGVAVNVTVVPEGKGLVHAELQNTPPGVLLTRPDPET